ncbi:restriction endonuclease PLD domain-containing protein [Rhizobium tropici]|uniref:NgoFVII family restriction endonuclease n=1 Tax=Rhizobium tropici TaxID=398 RepID=A0A329Y1S0_RHITR|nr:phospholipase D family protein [Rhizobium tropici]RAX37841.1 NgoFVII family restriction endonuclease [Rhizobium tropici]
MLIVQSAAEPAAIRNAIVDLIAPAPISMQVAAAYVTRGGSDILLTAVVNAAGPAAFAAMPKVLITSFDFGLTEPQALRQWLALPNTEVRVSGAQRLMEGSLLPTRAFHPKLYAFNTDVHHCNALVSSANLTSRGFSVNTEAAWAQRDVPRGEMDAAFTSVSFDTVPLTETILLAYEGLRIAQPPPPEIQQETQPVAPPAPLGAAATQLFRLAIANGAINPANFNAMWVQGEALQGGSRSQLELPRGGHRFFGFAFNQYDYPNNLTIGQPVIRSGARVWTDRRLTWHGNNGMERMNLPTLTQGGFNYADTAVMFRRLADGSFELIVTPWDSDLALSWRQASTQRGTLFRLGAIATNRLVGLL